ncbi:PEP/pyruvate-binding domain-containing protein [Bacillus sp. E(2018)]|uniref:PEP/pyruvate-binding domain-containing protein n=1 Tax=Bacillus sp. E(2018) TaxID=2502239 RepID=UPI0010F80657|nr:PEP/pyruvate-binding domain-containing protein [Bacillus sp. E(2018)]
MKVMSKNLIGNKAFNLYQLKENSLNVPPFMVITSDTNDHDLNKIMSSLEATIPSVNGWAVRSSSVVEDSYEKSFAGKFETVFISKVDELQEAVKKVLNSDESNHSMGVIVQEFIQAEYSGVVFSCNPFTGNEQVLIEVVEGQGEKLVSGFETPFMYEGEKWLTKEVLSDSIVEELKLVIKTMKTKFKCDVDMEFCVKRGELFWLQVRPVTKISNVRPQSLDNIKGDWFLLDQCTEPVSPLIQELDPAGFFNFNLWDTIFIDNYPYIQMKTAMFMGQQNVDVDVKREWEEIRMTYEPMFDEYLNEEYHEDSIELLWETLHKQINVYRSFTERYMDRKWMFMRRKVGSRLQELIKKSLGENVNLNTELGKLTTSLNTLTAQKVNMLNEIALDFNQQHTINQNLFRNFLNKFGYEMPHPVAIHLPSLGERPDELLFKIKELSKNSSKKESKKADWIGYANNISKKLSITLAEEFNEMLQLYRECLIRTEDDDYLLQKGAASTRKLLLEIGKRLTLTNKLKRPNMIFYLSKRELEKAVLLNKDINVNHKERSSSFRMSQARMPKTTLSAEKHEQDGKKVELLQGTGVSAGKALGEIYIINNPLDRNSYSIPSGSIVVAPVLTPNLSYNLISAAAVITEIGGFLSHGAIFAREVGIPAIVGVEDVCTLLKNGEKVRVDANNGLIEVIQK